MEDFTSTLDKISSDLIDLEMQYKHILIQAKKDYEDKRSALREKREKTLNKSYLCECGSIVVVKSKGIHELTKKHIIHRVAK
jgi:ElaB/YqjD/DUF883 family membrane-anchored ribosome-binding protein